MDAAPRIERTERLVEKLTQQVWELSSAVVLLSDSVKRHGEYDKRMFNSNRSIMKALALVARLMVQRGVR